MNRVSELVQCVAILAGAVVGGWFVGVALAGILP